VSDGSGQASYGVPSDDLENRLTERYWSMPTIITATRSIFLADWQT